MVRHNYYARAGQEVEQEVNPEHDVNDVVEEIPFLVLN